VGAERQERSAVPVGEEAEVADAHKTTGADAGVSGAGTLSKAQALFRL
jgi:hypothetical protein